MRTAIKMNTAEILTQSVIIYFLIVFWLVGKVVDNVARDDLDVCSGCGGENSDGLLVFGFVVISVVERSSLPDEFVNGAVYFKVDGDAVCCEGVCRGCASFDEMDVRTVDTGRDGNELEADIVVFDSFTARGYLGVALRIDFILVESVCSCILVDEVAWISILSVVRGGKGIRLEDVFSGTISEEEKWTAVRKVAMKKNAMTIAILIVGSWLLISCIVRMLPVCLRIHEMKMVHWCGQ